MLNRQRDAGRLGVKAHLHRALVYGAKAIAHHAGPNSTSGAVLCHLFKKIVVGVKEKRDTRNESLQIQSGSHSPIDVFDSVAQGECQFL